MHLFKYKETGSFYYRLTFNGRIYVRSAKTKNRQLAERVALQFRDSLVANGVSQTKTITLADALEAYADSRKDLASHRTLRSHIDFILAHATSGLTIDKLDSAEAEKIIRARRDGVAPATVKHTLNCLRATYNYAKRLGYSTQPIEWPQVTVRNQRQRYLTPQEEERFLNELSPDRTWEKMGDLNAEQRAGLQQNYDIGIALLDSGGRLNEVLTLKWTDINLKDKTYVLWRNKTNTGTTLTMTNRMAEMIERRAADKRSQQWVFPGAGDGPAISAGARIRKAIKRAGLTNFRLHDIRHSFASKLIQNGLSLYEVASALGHSSPNTTARYAHLEKRAVADKAANVLNGLNK